MTVEDSDHHDANAFLVAAAAVVVENDDATVKRRECRTCQNVSFLQDWSTFAPAALFSSKIVK